MRWLVVLVACGGSAPREPPANVTTEREYRPAVLRVTKPFKLELFDLEPKNISDIKALAAIERFTVELRVAANAYVGVTLGRRRLLLDEEIVHNCQRTAPGCLDKIARALHADRLIYGEVEGNGDVTIGMFIVGSDEHEWHSNTTPTAAQARTKAREAIEMMFRD